MFLQIKLWLADCQSFRKDNFRPRGELIAEGRYLSCSEFQVELANLANVPNFAAKFYKILNLLNVSKFNFKILVHFLNALDLHLEHFELSFRYLV